MSYSCLPPDLLADIAHQLDIPSAKSLALVSPLWRPAAESRVYRSIHITHADQLPKPIDADRKDHRKPSPNAATGEIFQTRLDAIQAHPWRRNQVREFTVELRRDATSSFHSLLQEISGGLRVLKVRLPPLLPTSTDFRLSALASLFGGGDLQFPVLEEVELDVGPYWLDFIVPLLVHSPRLRILSAKGLPCINDGEGTEATGLSAAVTAACARVPDRLQLRELGVANLSPEHEAVPLFETIVRNSPLLSVISVRDPGEHGGSIDSITGVLSTCGTITDLEIPSACLRAIHDRPVQDNVYGPLGPFANVTHLSVAWEYSDLRLCSTGPNPNLVTLAFPPFPSLKTCEYMLKSYISNIPPYDVYRGHLYDLAIKAIRHQALRDGFQSTPELEFIQLKDMYGPLPSGPGTNPVPSSTMRFMKAREMVMKTSQTRSSKLPPADGAFITRYHEEGTGNRLVYLRHRTAHTCGWEEYAVYNGKEVGMPFVSGAMSVNGIGAGQRHLIQPGVGKLNDKAWGVLKHCATLLK